MHETTQKIIAYVDSKKTYSYKQWHIGFTDDIKQTKKQFQASDKIVCEYTKTWPYKNKTEAKTILKELSSYGFIVRNKTPKKLIFIFFSVRKDVHKAWKALNTQKVIDFLVLK